MSTLTGYVTVTGNAEADALIYGVRWVSGPGDVLSYSFAGVGSLWDATYGYGIGSEPDTGFAPLSGIGQQAVRNALLAWSSVTGIEFQEVADDASGYGTVRIGYTTLGMDATQLGYTYAPAESANGGDVWLNAQFKDSLYASFTPGSLASYVVLHELGHALGLKHPHAESPLNGATLGSIEDSLFNSVMSYYAWPGVALTQTNIDRLPATPMALDIDALQALYGANSTYRSGDDTYTYDGDGKYLETIFDTGGNDTIEVTGSRDAEIDLRPDEWSRLGLPVQINAGSIQSADSVRNYHATQIENAIGGDGNDILIGNDQDNQLSGNAGNDTLEGGAGNDTLTGGIGADTYILSANGEDTISDFNLPQGDQLDVGGVIPSLIAYTAGENPFSSGFLTLAQSGAIALLSYDRDGSGNSYSNQPLATLRIASAGALDSGSFVQGYDPNVTPQYVAGLTLNGTEGNDWLEGDVDDDTINGLEGNDYLIGSGGSDFLDGGDGSDYLNGGPGNDTILGGAGDDTLYGEDGDDSVDGGSGNDNIAALGLQGNDTLLGGAGDDFFLVDAISDDTGRTITIDGGDGADQIEIYADDSSTTNANIVATGGAGVDTYYSALGFTSYGLVITDFAAGASGDLIDLVTPRENVIFSGLGYTGGNPFRSSLGYLRLIQNGANAELQFDADGAAGTGADFRTGITFQNVDKDALTSDNFLGGINPDGSSTLSGKTYFWNQVAQGSHVLGHVLMDGVTVSVDDGGTAREGTTAAGGAYSVAGIVASTVAVTAYQSYSTADEATVTFADTLEVLKLYLGKLANPSPYKYLAADFNADNKVTLTDALEVLKSVLNKTGALAPAWVFVDEEANLSALTRDSAVPPAIDAQPVATDPSLNLVAVLRGDANGSWKPAATASYEVLPDAYFIDPITGLVGLHPDYISGGQFGL